VAGSWKRISQIATNDSPQCTQWYGFISPPSFPQNEPPPPLWNRGSYKHPAGTECFECNKCQQSDPVDNCVCTPRQDLCGPLWSNLPDKDWAKISLTSANNIQILGDFADPISSANDPIFPFHHANIDRHFETWLQVNQNSANGYFAYPVAGYAIGSNLHDRFSKQTNFEQVLSKNFGQYRNGFYTIESVLALSISGNFSFSYDIFLENDIANNNAGRNLIGDHSEQCLRYGQNNIFAVVIAAFVYLIFRKISNHFTLIKFSLFRKYLNLSEVKYRENLV